MMKQRHVDDDEDDILALLNGIQTSNELHQYHRHNHTNYLPSAHEHTHPVPSSDAISLPPSEVFLDENGLPTDRYKPLMHYLALTFHLF